MRNGHKPAIGVLVVLVVVIMTVAIGSGCASRNAKAGRTVRASSSDRTDVSSQILLDAGYQALENQQYNEAIAKAEEFLARTPHGPGSAEALYLKGRGFEGKNAAGVTADEARQNLQSARAAYIEALEQVPRQPLESYVHASLGNVAYFQDDYQSAIAQLNAAYDKLDSEDLKAWVLYRVGLSQQRMGQFAQADKTFASVQQFHPNSVPAQRAREHQGAKAFYVQLATFASPQTADNAAGELRRQGMTASRVSDAQGRALLRVGPIASYSQAQYVRGRFAEKYPDAFILP
jgi:outer membrane protein assembly factor BamD (BamD/ComL family)